MQVALERTTVPSEVVALAVAPPSSAPRRQRYPIPPIDRLTIARAQAGDPEAFDAIYAAHEAAVYNYVLRLVGDRDLALDLTQDVFLKAWLHLPRTSCDLAVTRWIMRIATNRCMDEFRHRRLVRWESLSVFQPGSTVPGGRFGQADKPLAVSHDQIVAALTVDDPDEEPERSALGVEQQLAVRDLVRRLPLRPRMALVLREYLDYTYAEIGAVLEITLQAVKSLIFRAREAIRAMVAADPTCPLFLVLDGAA
jgi:RNA polymerase sigma-70 factor (ECF subfamily)